MQATTVKLHSLGYDQAKTYWIAALFVAGNVLLPQLCHLVPQGGVRWLPIYFFTLIAAYKYGWRAGMLTAVASPLINSALFGMPAADTLPPILFKSSLLAVAAGLTAARCRRVSLPLLAAVVLGYQAIGTLGEWAMTGSLRAALQDFRIGLPGMSLQILGGWAFMRWMLRRYAGSGFRATRLLRTNLTLRPYKAVVRRKFVSRASTGDFGFPVCLPSPGTDRFPIVFRPGAFGMLSRCRLPCGRASHGPAGLPEFLAESLCFRPRIETNVPLRTRRAV